MDTPATSSVSPATVMPARSRSRKPVLVLLGMAVLTVAGLWGWHEMSAGQEQTDDAQVEADVVPLSARIGGFVQAVLVKDDQHVKKGQPLLQLDEADLRVRVRAAEADLETAKAQLSNAEAQQRIAEANSKGGLHSAQAQVSGSSVAVTGAGSQIAVARAGVDRARVDLQRAETELKRAEALASSGAGSQERADNAHSVLEGAKVALAVAKAQVGAAEENKQNAESRVEEARGRLEQSASLQAQIEAAAAGVKLAQARVLAAQSGLDQANLTLSYAKVVAPNDGTVTRVQVRAGQMLAMGQPVAWLVPETTYIVANFKETQVGAMRPGQKVRVELDAFPGHELEGTLGSLAGGTGSRFALLPPDNASGNFVKVVQRVPVRIAWAKKPDVPLRAGLSADVVVVVGR